MKNRESARIQPFALPTILDTTKKIKQLEKDFEEGVSFADFAKNQED